MNRLLVSTVICFLLLYATAQAQLSSTAGIIAPSFMVNKGASNQTLSTGVRATLTWSTETFDTNDNFASNTFTPTVPGYYFITLSIYCSDATSTSCEADIFMNGSTWKSGYLGTTAAEAVSVNGIAYFNGTTDNVDARAVVTVGVTVSGSTAFTYFAGSYLHP